MLLQRHAERNINSQVTPSPTNKVLSWIVGIKSIFDGVPQTASQDTGVPGTSNVGEHSSELNILDDPSSPQFILKSIKAQRLPINHRTRTSKHKQAVYSPLKLLAEFPVKIQRGSSTIPFSGHDFHRYPIRFCTFT
jgi:hypothetical protein